MKKKVLSLLLSAVMILSLAVPVSAVSVNSFSDVSPDSWYYESVSYVAERDYMNGTSGTTFSPDDNMTRAMFATVISRVAGAEVDNSVQTDYTDVPAGMWYTGAVQWGTENDLITGYGNGLFGTDDSITRQDIAVLMERFLTWYCHENNRALRYEPIVESFTDEESIAGYAREAVEFCREAGLLTGYEDGSFRPLGTATRAEIAAVIERIDFMMESSSPAVIYTGEDGSNAILEVEEGAVVMIEPAGGSVTYDGTDYSDTFEITVEGSGVSLPAATRSGYVFMGWQVTTGSDGVMTLTAQWSAADTDAEISYTGTDGNTVTADVQVGDVIYINPNGGSVTYNGDTRYAVFTARVYEEGIALPAAVRSGYIFTGWQVETGSDGLLTFTAQWTESGETVSVSVSYTAEGGGSATAEVETGDVLTVNPNGGRVTYGGTSYNSIFTITVGESDITLPAATRGSYRFRGWALETGSDGTYTFTAQWQRSSGSSVPAGTTYRDYSLVLNLGKQGTEYDGIMNIYDDAGSDGVYHVAFDADGNYLENYSEDISLVEITKDLFSTANIQKVLNVIWDLEIDGEPVIEDGVIGEMTVTTDSGEHQVNPVDLLLEQYGDSSDGYAGVRGMVEQFFTETGVSASDRQAITGALDDAGYFEACDPAKFFEADEVSGERVYRFLSADEYSDMIADVIDASNNARLALIRDDVLTQDKVSRLIVNLMEKTDTYVDGDEILNDVRSKADALAELIMADDPTLLDFLSIQENGIADGIDYNTEITLTQDAMDAFIRRFLERADIGGTDLSVDLSEDEELIADLAGKLAGVYSLGVNISVSSCDSTDTDH